MNRKVANQARIPGFYLEYYLSICPEAGSYHGGALQHYLDLGWKEGRDPSPGFGTKDYLKAHPDAESAGVNPLAHYLDHGLAEGRVLNRDITAVDEAAKSAVFADGYWFVVPDRIADKCLFINCWAVDKQLTTGEFFITINGSVSNAVAEPAYGSETLSQRLSSKFGKCAFFQVAWNIENEGVAEILCFRTKDGSRMPGSFYFKYSNGKLFSRSATEEQINRANKTNPLVHAFTGYDDYRKLDMVFRELKNKKIKSLDWGIGNARVAQHFMIDDKYDVYGCDIDPVNVEALWSDNFDTQRLKLMEAGGRIPFDNESFDAIYGISVFTHLTPHYQDFYLSELHRILRPGGLGVFSVHGPALLHVRVGDPTVSARVSACGIYISGSNSDLSKGFDRAEKERLYVDAFHSSQYILLHWKKFFSEVRILPAVPIYQHDLVICSKD